MADIDSYPMLRSATEPATPPGDIATVTGRLLDVGAARRTGGDAGSEQVTSAPGVADASATGMLALMQRYRGSAPKSLAASLLGTHAVDALVAKHGKDWFGELPAETYKAVAHDMGMLGAGTSPREALAFEDRTAIAGWIDAQPWDDARKQSAHEELHTRAGLEDRRRTEARDKAKEAAFATIDKLGAGFISVNQLPPAVRRDLGEDAMAALTLRANRNVHPMTVAAHGDVAMDLNRMAATDPETFAKQDLRLRRDEMTPVEYDALGRLQKGIGTYPPAPSAMTQRRALETMQRNGLDVGPRGADVTNQPTAIEGGAPPDAAPERSSQTDEEVDRLANVETIPEALRGADTTKAAIREMLRNDWTPDQIQNQLYEAYARRSLGLSFDDHPGGVGSLPDQGNPEELVPEARFRNIASEQNGQITFDPNGRPVVSPDGASPSDAILGSLFPPPQPVKKRVPSNQLDYGDFSTLWEAERKKGVKLPKFVPAEAWKKFAPDAEKMHPETLARPYDRITLHHTGSEDTPEAVETLHGHEPLWHKLGRKINNPANQEDYDTYGDVGYHFLIGRDGTIYEGRSLAYQGAHVMNQNERNIGIAFLGDYSKRQLKPAQINSTKYLIRELNRAYGVNTNAQGLPYVVTHRELAPSGQFARPDELLGAQKQTDEIEAWSRRFLPPLAKERAWVLQALPPARKSR
ncbi:MAG: peptidoglycan recognition family protein [Sphingomonas bacterium]